MMKRTTLFSILALTTLLVGGCKTTFEGRVTTGTIGYVGVVPSSDERLSAEGVAGVEIEVRLASSRNTGAMAGPVVAAGVTGPDGSFQIKASDQIAGAVQISAAGSDVFSAKGNVYPPKDGQQVLILVRERARAQETD